MTFPINIDGLRRLRPSHDPRTLAGFPASPKTPATLGGLGSSAAWFMQSHAP